MRGRIVTHIRSERMTVDELKALAQEVKPLVKNMIASESNGVGEIRKVTNVMNVFSLPAIEMVGDREEVVEVALTSLIGDTGKTPVITFRINSLPYGSNPTVKKSGTDEEPTIEIGFPLAQNGDNIVWRKTATGIDIKYARDPESGFKSFFSFVDVMPDVSDFSEEGIKILQKPATDAAEALTRWKVDVEGDINEVLRLSDDATRDALTAAELADGVRERTEKVCKETEILKGETETLKGETEQTKKDTEAVKAATDKVCKETIEVKKAAETATRLAGEATEDAKNAADRLNTLSDHRDKVVDGYWYRWNEELNIWEKTGEIAKGNTMYATFDFDPVTGELAMYADKEYAGPQFELDNGILSVII